LGLLTYLQREEQSERMVSTVLVFKGKRRLRFSSKARDNRKMRAQHIPQAKRLLPKGMSQPAHPRGWSCNCYSGHEAVVPVAGAASSAERIEESQKAT